MTEDLGWTPVPPASLPWKDINQLILFNLATENGPGLDAANLWNVDVPTWAPEDLVELNDEALSHGLADRRRALVDRVAEHLK